MDGKVSKPTTLRNKNAPKAPESGTPEAGNHLVRMRSAVQIRPAAPENSRNHRVSGVFVAVLLKFIWVRMWVNRTDPHRDPHAEMSGKGQRVPGRKFCFPAWLFSLLFLPYMTFAIKFPIVSAAWFCICRVAWV